MSTEPYEIVAAPFTLWVAPVGTSFPTIEEAPGGSWTKVGTSGDLNYTEDGVTVEHPQSVEFFRALGSTGPRKAFRTEEELLISLNLADLTLEQYALALNHNTVTTLAPAPGEIGSKKIGLSRGLEVPQRALLVRGANASPYGTGWGAQYEVPVAVQIGEPEVVFQKGEPAGLSLQWAALEDPDAASAAERFGRLVAQNAAAGA
jgi:hypothetical protein